eukprot:252110_1
MGTSQSKEKNEVQVFLAEMNLDGYYKKLAADGWTTMETLMHITEKDLVDGVGMKRGFAIQVLNKLRKIEPLTAQQKPNTKTKAQSGITNTINNETIKTNAKTEQLAIFKNKITDKFVLRNATTHGITRLKAKREMIIGLFDKHMFSHSKVCVVYFSKIAAHDEIDEEKEEKYEMDEDVEGIPLGVAIASLLSGPAKTIMAPRLFQFELFINENKENILSVTGPEKLPEGYTCKQFYAIKSTMNNLIDIGRNVMNNHGKYNYVLNNCRYFTSSYLELVKAETDSVKLKADANDISKALEPYEETGAMNNPTDDQPYYENLQTNPPKLNYSNLTYEEFQKNFSKSQDHMKFKFTPNDM